MSHVFIWQFLQTAVLGWKGTWKWSGLDLVWVVRNAPSNLACRYAAFLWQITCLMMGPGLRNPSRMAFDCNLLADRCWQMNDGCMIHPECGFLYSILKISRLKKCNDTLTLFFENYFFSRACRRVFFYREHPFFSAFFSYLCLPFPLRDHCL